MANIEMPDGRIIEFPDTMSTTQIGSILEREYQVGKKPPPTPAPQPVQQDMFSGLPVGEPRVLGQALHAPFIPLQAVLNAPGAVSAEGLTMNPQGLEQGGASILDFAGGASRGLMQQGAATGALPFNITKPEDFGNIAETAGRVGTELAAMGPYAAGLTKGLGQAGRVASAAEKGVKNYLSAKRIESAELAAGQILQGKTKDIAKGIKAFGSIETNSVKTYADLSKKIEAAIPEYASKVDDALLKDPNTYKLDKLITTQKTTGGQTVTSNHVQDALKNLKELYAKTNNPVKAGNIDELLAKATTRGLTKKEVNDIAKIYSSEYRAFSITTGEPLTAVSKQAYENTRRGLKGVARRGLDDTAKKFDDTLSSLLNTQRLIKKNVEAVNRLKQKIDHRGLGEKAGRMIFSLVDKATLGTVKGFVHRAMPRGLGYKIKNYIDLENSLARNLKTVNTITGKLQ